MFNIHKDSSPLLNKYQYLSFSKTTVSLKSGDRGESSMLQQQLII